jgi:RNA polymerase sigma factor (sigma-70 family)
MSTGLLDRVVRHVHTAVLAGGRDGPTDGELLECFVRQRDELAFAALVRRHGPMVLGLCRRVVGNPQDAEDAFQATFLVLVRRAASLGAPELVGNWLYGVAYRTARKARAISARRRQREAQVEELPQPAVEPEGGAAELWGLLDQELNRLPDRYRVPVVLCELEGRSRREVARLLCLPEGTLSSRLAAARKMLARRLSRRGLALTGLTAAVAPSLAATTARAAVAGLVPAPVCALAEGVLQTMMLSKLKIAVAVLLVLGIFGTGAGLLTRTALADKPSLKPVKQAVAVQKEKKEQGPSVHGTVKAVDAGKNTVTLTMMVTPGKKETEERTYDVASDARITLQDVLSKKETPPTGKLADLLPGTGVNVRLSVDKKSVVEIGAWGPTIHGYVKSADPGKHTLTIGTKYSGKPTEMTFQVLKDAKIIKDDGLGKKGDKKKAYTPKEGTFADLVEGVPVLVRVSVNRKTALGIAIQGASLHGTIKSYDDGTRTLTVTVKEDAQIVDKALTLAKGANVSGDLVAGARVNVTLSVHDKGVASAVKVLKDE